MKPPARRRVAITALVLALTSAGLFPVAPLAGASAVPAVRDAPLAVATPSATTRVLRDLEIKLSDGTTLRADAHLPAGTGRKPVVLTLTPYSKNKQTSTAGTNIDPIFPRNGYVQLVVDVRGTGASEGVLCVFCKREQRDAGEVVRWAAKQPWSNGSVVSYGASYAAISGLFAAQQPGTNALKAVYSAVPLGDMFRDIINSGGSPNLLFPLVWGYGLVSTESIAAPLLSAQSNPILSLNATTQHLLGNAPTLTSWLAVLASNGTVDGLPGGDPRATATDSSFYRERSPLTHIDRIKVPTFLVGGQADIFQRSLPMIYDALDLRPQLKKLVLTPGYHLTTGDSLSSSDGRRVVRDSRGRVLPPENVLAIRWFDRWAKGKRNGMDAFPTVEQYWQGINRYEPQRSAHPRSRSLLLRLDATSSGTTPSAALDGSLTASRQRSGSATIPFIPLTGTCARNPVQYLFGAVPDSPCSRDNRVNETGAATFTSAPARSQVRMTGSGNLRLWTSSTRRETNVVAIISDVAPNGTSRQVSYGTLLGSQRRVVTRPCADKVPLDCTVYASDGQIEQVFHPFTEQSSEPMQPGRAYKLDVEILPFTLALRPGHRLRLSVTTGDFPASPPTTSLLTGAVGSAATLYFDRRRPSTLRLSQPTR